MSYEREILDLVAAIGVTEDLSQIQSVILQRLRKMVWFDTANFWLYPPVIEKPEEALMHLDSPVNSLNSYLTHYIHMDEFHQAYNQNKLLIARSTDLMDYGLWTRKSEYFNDFLRVSDAWYVLGFDIKDRNMAYGAICLHRGKGTHDFQEADMIFLQLLYPHLVNRLRWIVEKRMILRYGRNQGVPVNQADFGYFSLLTTRERMVVQQVLSGFSNEETAKNLGLSVNTIKMHLQNVYNKLGIKRRNQLFSMFYASEAK